MEESITAQISAPEAHPFHDIPLSIKILQLTVTHSMHFGTIMISPFLPLLCSPQDVKCWQNLTWLWISLGSWAALKAWNTTSTWRSSSSWVTRVLTSMATGSSWWPHLSSYRCVPPPGTERKPGKIKVSQDSNPRFMHHIARKCDYLFELLFSRAGVWGEELSCARQVLYLCATLVALALFEFVFYF